MSEGQCPSCGRGPLVERCAKWVCPHCYFIEPCCEGGDVGSGTNREARRALGSRVQRRSGTKTKAIPGQGSSDGIVNKSRTVHSEYQRLAPRRRLNA